MQREFANYDLCSPIIPLKTVGKFKSFSLLVMLQNRWLMAQHPLLSYGYTQEDYCLALKKL